MTKLKDYNQKFKKIEMFKDNNVKLLIMSCFTK